MTDDGRVEANRLVRAHRLWETYLEQTGTPQKEIHDKAHKLEHISDQATVDYLDDKLGHPLSDPHGSAIPADVSNQGGDRDFISSLLRTGNKATVQRVGPLADSFGFKPGDVVTMGARLENGTIWTLIAADGRELKLDHDQADSLIVRMVKEA